MDPQRKKQEKALKRKKQLQGEAKYKRELERQARLRARYPSIVVESTGADPEFIELLRTTAEKINFDDPSQFSELHRKMFRFMASNGAEITIHQLDHDAAIMLANGNSAGNFLRHSFLIALGTRLYELIPEAELRKYLPFNDMRVLPIGTTFRLQFSQMLKTKGPKGTTYYSRHRPQVRVDGRDFVVGFSRHAIERIVQRVNTKSLEYTPAGDVHALFSHCIHFEVVTLSDGEPALTFYDYCFFPGSIHYKTYVQGILGEENYDESQGKAYYRVGYCRLGFEDDFAKAINFVPPGYRCTPEASAIHSSSLPYSEKRRMIDLFKEDSGHIMRIEESWEELRWFHQNSVPQVIQSKVQFFNYA